MKEDVNIDEDNGNTLWQDTIKPKIKNSRVVLKLCKKGEKSPVGHTKITCHLIFALNIDMTCKS